MTAIAMTDHEAAIEDMIDRGVTLERVETSIEDLGLGPDEVEALKLYAWAWRETAPVAHRPLGRLRELVGT